MACKCKRNCTRISSNAVQNIEMDCKCIDVCANPICGDPKMLSIMAPLIYDEIGVNLCTTFTLGTDIATTYPTAVTASAQVLGIEYNYSAGNVQIEAIAGRPNCYVVTLSNLTITFAVKLYDSACRLLTTLYPTALYLPSETTSPTYDEDTNPTSVELEIFAPYGISYAPVGDPATSYNPIINNIGFLESNHMLRQGLNLFAIPKILDFSLNEGTATVGLTLILQSLYYSGYNVASHGRLQTPKGSILASENSDCMKFVAGELLDLKIKPLELSPLYGGNHREECNHNLETETCNTCHNSGINSSCSNNCYNCNGNGNNNPCNNNIGNACNGNSQNNSPCGSSSCSYFASDNTIRVTEDNP